MELDHKIYDLSVPSNLDGKNAKVLVDGEDRDISVKDIFAKHEFETGKIIGWSILQFYTLKDGFLVDKEGHKISLSTEQHPEIKFLKVRNPLVILDEKQLSIEYAKAVGTLLGMSQIENTITGLSPEDKKVLQRERELAIAESERIQREKEEEEAKKAAEEAQRIAEEEETKKAEAEAKKAQEEAEKAEEARKKAEQTEAEALAAKLKAEDDARIAAEEEAKRKREEDEKKKKQQEIEDGEFTYTVKQYAKLLKLNERNEIKEYEFDGYVFHYAAKMPKGENPSVFIKRSEEVWEQLPTAITRETEEIVEAEFNDGEDEKFLSLDLTEGKLTVESY